MLDYWLFSHILLFGHKSELNTYPNNPSTTTCGNWFDGVFPSMKTLSVARKHLCPSRNYITSLETPLEHIYIWKTHGKWFREKDQRAWDGEQANGLARLNAEHVEPHEWHMLHAYVYANMVEGSSACVKPVWHGDADKCYNAGTEGRTKVYSRGLARTITVGHCRRDWSYKCHKSKHPCLSTWFHVIVPDPLSIARGKGTELGGWIECVEISTSVSINQQDAYHSDTAYWRFYLQTTNNNINGVWEEKMLSPQLQNIIRPYRDNLNGTPVSTAN